MRVLITRPEDDAARIASELRARGHEPVSVPLLAVRFHDGDAIALDEVQAILATSANGVRALARRSPRRDMALFAVGPQTTETARELGFRNVKNAQGDSVSLAHAALQGTTPGGGALLHAKGAEGDGTLARLLQEAGRDVTSVVLYDVAAAQTAPARLREAFGQGLDAALFFSARSARAFKDCSAGLVTDTLIAACISEATARMLSPLSFREIRVAAEPNQDALLACLT